MWSRRLLLLLLLLLPRCRSTSEAILLKRCVRSLTLILTSGSLLSDSRSAEEEEDEQTCKNAKKIGRINKHDGGLFDTIVMHSMRS